MRKSIPAEDYEKIFDLQLVLHKFSGDQLARIKIKPAPLEIAWLANESDRPGLQEVIDDINKEIGFTEEEIKNGIKKYEYLVSPVEYFMKHPTYKKYEIILVRVNNAFFDEYMKEDK